MQPHRNRSREIGHTDDDRDRTAANGIAEDHETRRQAPVERDTCFGRDRKRLDRRLAELRDEVKEFLEQSVADHVY